MKKDRLIFRRSFCLFFDVQLQNIGSCIVSAAVKFHAAGRNLLHVEVGVDDRFFIPDGLARVMSEGVNDAAAAAAGNALKAGNFVRAAACFGVIRAAEEQIGVDKVAVRLNGNVPDGVLLFRIVVGVG